MFLLEGDYCTFLDLPDISLYVTCVSDSGWTVPCTLRTLDSDICQVTIRKIRIVFEFQAKIQVCGEFVGVPGTDPYQSSVC